MKVDMSPEAIDARLKMTSELLKLCLSLGTAKPIAHPLPRAASEQNPAAEKNLQRRSSER